MALGVDGTGVTARGRALQAASDATIVSRPASAAILRIIGLRVFGRPLQAYGYYSDTMTSRTVSLTGWGRIAPTRAELAEPATVAGAARLLETRPPARDDRPRPRPQLQQRRAVRRRRGDLHRPAEPDPRPGPGYRPGQLRGRRQPGAAHGGGPAGRMVRAGLSRHPPGDGGRRDRGRRARQEPPRGRQLRPAPAVGRHRPARRRAAHGDRSSPTPGCSGRPRAGWA